MTAVAPSADGPRSPSIAERSPREETDFDGLFRRCASDVHAYAISLLRDRAAAEEVTALAFERLYRARSRLDRARGTPRSLLFAIARNAALDELRRRRRHPESELDESVLDDTRAGEQPAAALERAERLAVLRDALRSLPLRDRELVLLKFHGQLSNAELAQALGISESNAGTRLHRALTRLRAQCGQLAESEAT